MAEPLHVAPRELTSGQILDALADGRRVLVAVSVLGTSMQLAIRKHEGTYYCDTPVTLFTYDSPDGLRRCLERYRIARPTDGTTPAASQEVANGG